MAGSGDVGGTGTPSADAAQLGSPSAARLYTANGASLGLDPVLSTDVDSRSFERDCDCRAFEKGVDLYNGDFLSGFALPDCPEFEEWAFFRREALRSRLVQALERLTEAKISTGEPRTRPSMQYVWWDWTH